MRSVLITGATGFFGRAFVRRLLADGEAERICIFSRGEHAQAQMREDFGHDPRLRWFIGDARDRDRVTRAMDGCDTVVHAAALKRIEVGRYNPEEMVKTNVVGSMNVIEAARISYGIAGRNVVFLSSDKAFEPVSPYGQSKALAESLFLAANETSGGRDLRFSVCRYGNIWNSTGSVVPRWQALVSAGRPVNITDPSCTRFFMRVEEAVDLVLSTLHEMPSELAIPELPAFMLADLANAMDAKVNIVGLPAHEKKHESMRAGLCSETAPRLSVQELRQRLATI